DAITLVVFWDVDPAQTSVGPSSATMPDALIGSFVAAARARDMRVVLYPLLRCASCPDQSRSMIRPLDRDRFFASYRSMTARYTALAQDTGVWLYVIGSELTSLESDGAQWRRTAAIARQHFTGLLGYDVNWDHVTTPSWDAVDIAAVSAYFPLSDAPQPGLEELERAWTSSDTAAFRGRRWTDELVGLAQMTGHPVLFGEAGYRSMTYAARDPS